MEEKVTKKKIAIFHGRISATQSGPGAPANIFEEERMACPFLVSEIIRKNGNKMKDCEDEYWAGRFVL